MIRSLVASVAALVLLVLGAPNVLASDFGIQTVNPVFNDASGRTGMIHRTYRNGDVTNICSAAHYKDGYWLSAAHCFTGKYTSPEQESAYLKDGFIAVWVDGVLVKSKIEEIAYAEGSRDYTTDGSDSHKNDLVVLKTAEDIAPNGFSLASELTPPVDQQLMGSGSGTYREYPTTTIISGVFEKYLEDRNQVWYADKNNYGTGICPGDSGGPAYVEAPDDVILYGVWTATVMSVGDSSCDLSSWRPGVGYTPVANNLSFIHGVYGNLGSDRVGWNFPASSNIFSSSNLSS